MRRGAGSVSSGVADPLAPYVLASLERLVADLAGRKDHGDLAHRLDGLIEILIHNGQLTEDHRAWLVALEGERSRIKLVPGGNKRAVPSPDVDCAALIPLCKGRCCALTVTLSREDLDEGRLRWDLHDPYVLPKDPATGYCANLRAGGGCCVYDDRPATCRSYDCRNDPRVWIDYARRIPAPLPAHLVAPDDWPVEK